MKPRHSIGGTIQYGVRSFETKPSTIYEALDRYWKEVWMTYRMDITDPRKNKRLQLQMNSSVGWMSSETRRIRTGVIVASAGNSSEYYRGVFVECAPVISWMLTPQIGLKASTRIRHGFVTQKEEKHSWAGILDENGIPLITTEAKQENCFYTSYIPLELSVSWSF